MNFDVKGKVAIVTGGYTGIGRSISEALAEAGANIVIGARNYDQCRIACVEIGKLGVQTLPVKCDVSNPDDVQKLIQEVMDKFGAIDILFNNAGVIGTMKSIIDITDEEWRHTQATNLDSIFYCSRAAASIMMLKKTGKIINVTSAASFKALPKFGDYCTSKAGAYMLTKIMALELAPYNIQVNAICPGYVRTNLNSTMVDYVSKHAQKFIPVGKIAETNDIKGLALFLSSAASDYITGSAMIIDGGVLCAG